ncbi:MAG: pyruvate/2-oxoglutarate dehydrogenase complex, dihydrolipoamide dehydrogenase component [Planctomycetaceae bacterium]|nr:pyruvate/2-oxoglutarate dehydrogenase complex, dihydrolipoamide dehydrogenase component [Planctomycetaceae bacterium]
MTDIVILGAGPAGVLAALRSAELGAKTVLVASGEFGGMATNDGPVPVRTLAHAAHLIREARQLSEYGITTSEPVLDYSRLLARVSEVVNDVRVHSSLRRQIDTQGVTLHEHAGTARFIDQHTIETERGLRIQGDRFIICTGGISRQLPIPGFELTSTHSDAWALKSVPPSMIVIGSGATGVQVASIFNSFGTHIQLFEPGPRIVHTEDEDVSAALATAFRAAGIVVHENFGTIESFEKAPSGVRINYLRDGDRNSVDATMAVVATGWVANTARLNLAAVGVELDGRGFVNADKYLQTSVPDIFAAGDITGRTMIVPQALQDGFVAATNAVQGLTLPLEEHVSPIGSFTDPEYAQVGLTEAKARTSHDVVTALVHFDATTRSIIDGRKVGFCKLIADRQTCRILGCHVIGERAVEITQVAAMAIAAGMRVDELAQIPLSFPTYAGILPVVAASAARQLNLTLNWQTHQVEGNWR